MTTEKQQKTMLQGSREAKQATLAILEALSGLTTTTEAAERMEISHSRYYQLETRALEGMMAALEPRTRGPKSTPEGRIKALLGEKADLERELRRLQSLLRQATRGLGLKARPKAKKKRGRKRAASRGKTVLKTLRHNLDGASDGPTKRDESVVEGDGRKQESA